MTAKPRTYDTTSAEPVLFFIGPAIDNVPDTDLSANQLARIAFIRDTDTAAVADALVATGSYSPKPATPAPEPEG